MENVITLGILIGLLLLFCPPSSLFCFENSKNTRNELARPGMGTIFLVKRASEASEAFSLVMKTHNCLRLRGLTRNTCPHLAYGVHVLASNRHACLSVPGTTSPSPLRVSTHIEHVPGVDRYHYAAFQSHFNKVLTKNCSFISKKLKTTRKRK